MHGKKMYLFIYTILYNTYFINGRYRLRHTPSYRQLTFFLYYMERNKIKKATKSFMTHFILYIPKPHHTGIKNVKKFDMT